MIEFGRILRVACMAVALTCAGVVPSSAQVIKLGTIAPKGSPWHDALVELSQKWGEISEGRVKVRIYADGVAGDEPVMIRKMRIGQIQAAALTTLGLINIEPDVEVLSFPTMVRTDDELDYVIEKVGPLLEKGFEEKGFKVLNWTLTGWVRFFTKDPVTTLDDMKKHRVIFWGDDTAYTEFLKKIGINPVPLAVTDMLPALQTGLADAFAAPPVAALAFQWFGLAKNMTDLAWQPVPGTVVVSTKTWNRIPDPLKPKLAQAAREIGDAFLGKSRALELEAIKVMKENGLKVSTLPDETVAEWQRIMREKGEPVWVGPRISRDMFELVESELKAYRSKSQSEGKGK